jgi:hypothetical protein
VRRAFGVEHGGRGDADGRLAAAHLAVDDRGAFATVDQQLGGGVDDFGLGRNSLRLRLATTSCRCACGWPV